MQIEKVCVDNENSDNVHVVNDVRNEMMLFVLNDSNF
jgi:hypothetical protein